MFKYSINLSWSEEDESYVATIPEFPGLTAFGDTPEEAAEEAKIAAQGFIEVFKEDGLEIPEPDTWKEFSGQTRLRMPKSLHARLSREADKEGVSLNSHILSLLSSRQPLKEVDKKLANMQQLLLSKMLPIEEVVRSPGTSASESIFILGKSCREGARVK